MVFDLDRTVYQVERVRDGAAACLDELAVLGTEVVFFTNTSTKSRVRVEAKLERYGLRVSGPGPELSAEGG